MKNMMKILALGLFVAGSVVFSGCNGDKTDSEKKKAETSANTVDANAVSFNVEGMSWVGSWGARVKAKLAELPGVAIENVNVVDSKTVTVSAEVDSDDIVAAIKEAGFEASVAE